MLFVLVGLMFPSAKWGTSDGFGLKLIDLYLVALTLVATQVLLTASMAMIPFAMRSLKI